MWSVRNNEECLRFLKDERKEVSPRSREAGAVGFHSDMAFGGGTMMAVAISVSYWNTLQKRFKQRTKPPTHTNILLIQPMTRHMRIERDTPASPARDERALEKTPEKRAEYRSTSVELSAGGSRGAWCARPTDDRMIPSCWGHGGRASGAGETTYWRDCVDDANQVVPAMTASRQLASRESNWDCARLDAPPRGDSRLLFIGPHDCEYSFISDSTFLHRDGQLGCLEPRDAFAKAVFADKSAPTDKRPHIGPPTCPVSGLSTLPSLQKSPTLDTPLPKMSSEQLNYLINHIFLPPQIPQEDDASSDTNKHLCACILEAGASFRDTLISIEERQEWATVMKMLERLVCDQPSMGGLADSMGGMSIGDSLVVHVAAQNAAVILRKRHEGMIVESFEVDPPNQKIMATTGRVGCTYPHAAIGVPNSTFDDYSFRQEFSSFLANMAVDALPDSEAFVKKAGTRVSEYRDSASGHYITHLLPAILGGYTGAFSAHVYGTKKRVRNEIRWKDARAPWRRNPLWLVIRVAIQSVLRQNPGSTDNLYKSFMVHLMAQILSIATKLGVSSELLFCMRAKIARRITKLPALLPQMRTLASLATVQATQMLESRWEAIQVEQQTSSHWAPETFNLDNDTRLSLRNSKAYIEQRIAQVGDATAAPRATQPTEPPRVCQTTDFRSLTRASLRSAFRGSDRHAFLALSDFETSVQNHIDEWVGSSRKAEDCEVLVTCIEEYNPVASVCYQGHPESQSLRFLTILELWVALDRLALSFHPQLRDFEPEVPVDILEPLLINQSLSLERAKYLHRYLCARHGGAISGRSVFTDDVGQHTFAAQCYASSEKLQRLHNRIIADAEKSRTSKLNEFANLKTAYNALVDEARALVCTYLEDRWGTPVHSGSCTKCVKERTAAQMVIQVHEWPLPAGEADAINVVFELNLPTAFRVWRDTTTAILGDASIHPKSRSPDIHTVLHNYSALKAYQHDAIPRVTLASSAKPFVVSHYRTKLVSSATEEDICKPNGLRYRLYDEKRKCWAPASFSEPSFLNECTPTLPRSSPYLPLANTIGTTLHTPNSVIASQDQADRSLSLHEHISFGTLRSGGRLQWLNIARELRTRVLSFHHTEVHTLFAQAASQLGPITPQNSVEWHVELDNLAFGHLLLDEIEQLIVDVQDNWSNATTVETAVLLLCRWLVSARTKSELVARGYSLLREARWVAYGWMRDLVPRLHDLTDNASITDFQTRICSIAAICHSTYNVDPIHFEHVFSSDDDVSKFIECSIIIHDTYPFRNANVTEPLPGQNACWARTTTAGVAGASAQIVDINIRDGTFLVDGKPLGRLPEEIIAHGTYVRLFNKLPGMDFATRQSIFGAQVKFVPFREVSQLNNLNQIHFRLSPTKELIVQAQRDSIIHELVPHRKFDGDLPDLFVNDYTHWIHFGEESGVVVELRPRATWWNADSNNWRIDCSSWQMCRNNSLTMVDIHSPTFTQCFNQVAAVEDRPYVVIAIEHNSAEPKLQVELCRYKLSFFVNTSGELESVDLRSMVIDGNQSAGAFFGLSRQLVLRAKDPNATQSTHPSRRIVIVPFGKISPRKSGHHVKVDIALSGKNIRYFKYEINTDMGYLRATTLTAGFYKTLLHACTAHPLVDPLTSRTGTEEALSELVSARSFSFQQLGDDDTNLLKEIVSLSPGRRFYPAHLQEMETVTWGNIWPLAQHHAFHPLAESILHFAGSLLVFQPTTSATGQSHKLDERQEHLYSRSASEIGKLWPVEFAHFKNGAEDDGGYLPPDNVKLRSNNTESRPTAGRHATETAALVQAWPSRLPAIPDLRRQVESWQYVSADTSSPVVLSYNQGFMDSGFLQPMWCRLYTQLVHERTSIRSSKLTFTLASIAYQLPQHRSLLPTLLSFASVGSAFQPYPCPSYPGHVYDFGYGLAPTAEELMKPVRSSAVAFGDSTFAKLTKNSDETGAQFYSRCHQYYITALDSQLYSARPPLFLLGSGLKLACQIWPCERPAIPASSDLLRPILFQSQVSTRFLHCFRNRLFHEHLGHVESLVQQHNDRFDLPAIARYQLPAVSFFPGASFRPPTLSQVFHQKPAAAEFASSPPVPELTLRIAGETPQPSTVELRWILEELFEDTRTSSVQLRQLYINAIESSRQSLQSQKSALAFSPPTMQELKDYHARCRIAVEDMVQSIDRALRFQPDLRQAGQFPRIDVRSLLSQLCLLTLHPLWKDNLVALAQSIIRLQRSQRLLRFFTMNMQTDLKRELANYAFDAEEAFWTPEWLLIQIDNNFIVRPIQSAVAKEMMTPSSNDSTISQLNMGEGKTTVIVPLITSLLADGKTLARAIALKQLAGQMFQTLRNTLSGLLNRRIFYFPFSRDVQPGVTDANKMQSLFELCMRERGVWIAQPEHILSFKLMGMDLMLDAASETDHSVSGVLLNSQKWLNHNVRDILDESDEILDVRYQLVYTSGRQAPLEDHPDRWITMQGILAHVHSLAPALASRFPTGVEIQRPGTAAAFHSSIRILSEEAGHYLIRLVGEKILQSNEYRLLPPKVRQDLFHFITESKPSIPLGRLRETCGHTLWNGILLRRGILAGGILVFALNQKRWRVNYGLDLRRTMLAVPYRAKDVPSLRTDFGHPDVAIILTCLSYYYGGLTDKQFDLCLELLLKLDNPALEYELWVKKDDQIPTALREVIGINPQDMDQRRNVLTPLFRRNLAVVNFYLRSVVFPKEAKQFPHKLSTSAWDLAERKKHLTTGFSGTNDNQYLLPTSITQRDPLNQLSTAAKVLSYLLQPESKPYCCLGTGCSTQQFMNFLVKQTPEIRVLLDVGAQMLEMQNRELAEYWLSISPRIKAVVYFDSGDNLMVLGRDGSSEPLISSSFADRLEDCAVYLDDVHTRGTDLKLPINTRAALTLGPGVTKDRLVQGAMRLRQLGEGQSVMFFAPPEVDLGIRSISQGSMDIDITSREVVQWVMHQTISSIDHSVSHWADQGVNYKRRQDAWSHFENDSSNAVQGLRSTWVEKESRTLREMYDFGDSGPPMHQVFWFPDMAERLRLLGCSHILDASKNEEQEREVAHEKERERQVERPPAAQPAEHCTYDLVTRLVQSGVLERDSRVFVPPFSVVPELDRGARWSTRILATQDFVTTVKGRGHPKDYLRPVTWILSAPDCLVLISPWEANKFLPYIRQSSHVHLHQYAPRTMASMRSFEDLDFYTIPASRPVPAGRWSPNEIAQLNIFAGQLYLKSFAEYGRLCDILGLYVNDTISGDGSPMQYESDGFVKPADRRGAMVVDCLFRESPLSAVKDLVGWRRKGLNYEPTHMGKILHGGLLEDKDFV
ncbi:hypothetical protein FB45DRAFT_876332 [Roridomyces roridus]|uniref:ubiquitinyl hydrolase 1 n=1 Tax=Roridomyces roridus TaxID=1738132 RepID=A0AAD7B4F0_9AGAR|nr:hypothetical protein FB45DRAFT_876332 [Roridomyces roridus]